MSMACDMALEGASVAPDTENHKKLIPDDVAQSFRVYEFYVCSDPCSINHGIQTTTQTKEILATGQSGLKHLVIYLLGSIAERDPEDRVFQVWREVMKYFAKDLGAADAPENSQEFIDWLRWAAKTVGITFVIQEEP